MGRLKKLTGVLMAGLMAVSAGATEKVGLVLSGGGAKGIAHVGVIKALEDNDIPIDYVTGTSMGAIVGSLYSCGWSPEEMLKFFTSPEFGYWSTGKIDPSQTYYVYKPSPTPQWVGFNINLRNTSSLPEQLMPQSVVSPIPMNLEFLELYAPYTKQCKGDFNNLFVPFRCVFSDIYAKHKVVCKDGSLGECVRGSMSFPMVFKPIKVKGILAYDGGIYDNFPVDVMQTDFNPDFIIGVSVSGPDPKPQSDNLYQELEDMIIQNNDYSVPSKNGIKIQVPVLNFGVLDFDQAQTIYDIGYKTGLQMVDSVKSRVRARRSLEEVNARREKFAAATPGVEFNSIEVEGAEGSKRAYLKYLFDQNKKLPIDMKQVSSAYFQAVGENKLKDILPEARFDFNRDETALVLKTIPKNPWSLGVGGWITSTTNSFLFLDAGYHTLSHNSLDVDLSGWLGQTYYAGRLAAKFALRTPIPSFLHADVVLSHQKYYDTKLLFYQNNTPAFIRESQQYGRVGYSMAVGKRGKFFSEIGYGAIHDSFYGDNKGNFAEKKRDNADFKTAVLTAGVDFNTLNDLMYPNSGERFQATIEAENEHISFLPGEPETNTGSVGADKVRWGGRVKVDWERYFPVSNTVSLGVKGTGLATIRKAGIDYTTMLVHAPEFSPTPSLCNYFDPKFRSDNYVSVGFIPVWNPVGALQLRGDFYLYAPLRELNSTSAGLGEYGKWFPRAEGVAQVAAVYNFPFASISLYGNYMTSANYRWNFGINLGLYFHAPKLRR